MVIMETLLPEGDEILAFRVIPLEGPLFSLPAFSFSLGSRTLYAPPLRIPVNPAPRGENAGAGIAGTAADSGERAGTPAPDGPESGEPSPFPPWPGGSGSSVPIWNRGTGERSRILWEGGQVVEALAELRRRERDHITGFTLAALRRELERSLNLEGEGDEIFRHPLLLVPLLLLCLILGALGLTVPRRLWHGRRFAVWACRGASLVFSVLALLCLLRLTAVRPLKGILPGILGGKTPRQALARGAFMYRAPEEGATRILPLREGQGLLVYEIRDNWAYAESPRDGITGWVKTGTYLIY
jgi:hypothetical protein